MRMIEESWLVEYISRAKAFGAKVAIDVGANVGEWTALLAENFEAVIAIEPDPRAFEKLVRLASDKVLCIHGAISSKPGIVDLYLRPESVQSSLLEQHPIGAGGQADAPVVQKVGVVSYSLDNIVSMLSGSRRDGPFFVKVDVEGAEGDVLAGATLDVLKGGAWLVEVHDRRNEVLEGLANLGHEEAEAMQHPLAGAHPEHFWTYSEPPR